MLVLAIDLTERLANASIGGGIALLIAWAVSRWSRLPALTNWVWRLAIVKCLLGLVWVSPLDVRLSKGNQSSINPALISTLPRQATWEERVSMSQEQAAATRQIKGKQPLPREELVVAAWIVGLLVVLYKEGRRFRRVRFFLDQTVQVANGPAQQMVKQLTAELRLRYVPKLLVAKEAVSPLLVGQWNPILVIPEALLDETQAPLLELALRHELWHLKRRDPVWTGLFHAAKSLLYFHPLLWVANRPWTRAQEAACDAAVLSAGTSREAYEDGLISLMRLRRQNGPQTGLLVVSGATLRHRLVMLNGWQQQSRLQLFSLVAGLALVAILGLIPWRVAPSGTVGNLADGWAWPQPIGEIDWSTPKLASPEESNGFKLLGLQRIHSYSPGELNGVTSGGSYLDPFTTAIWIQLPNWAVSPDLIGHASHTYAVRMVTSAGTCHLKNWNSPYQVMYQLALPVGYPDSVHEADLAFDVDGKQAALWHLTNLPKTPVLRAGRPRWITQNTAVGVPFEAFVKHKKGRYGDADWVAVSVYNTAPLPTDRYWELQFTGPFFNRVATSTFASGAGGAGVQLYGPTINGKLQSFVGPNGELGNSYAFAYSMSSAELHCNLIGFKSNQLKMTLRNAYLRDETSRNAPGMYLTVNGQDRFDTPLGIPIKICVFQNRQFQLSKDDPSFSLGLNKEFSPAELPNSPLAVYGKPIRVQVGTKGFRSGGGNAWMDNGFIELAVDTGVTPIPDQIEIIFTEQVDLENHPMDFLVPVEGPDSHPQKHLTKP